MQQYYADRVKTAKPLLKLVIYLFLFSALPGQQSFAKQFRIADNDSTSIQGAWNYNRWLEGSQNFANAVLKRAPDRYGKKNTPLWLSILSPNSDGLIKQKPPNWQTYWEAEDYVMTAQGCNLYRDMPTVSGFYKLSSLTGDPRYKDNVEQYLRYFLDVLPSPTTGIFPWGEHMSYNCVRDKIIATRHELEYNLPDWELLWRINPDAVKKEIEAIYKINIYDKKTFLYDRHANYYTGKFDPMPVRGTYIKHSGYFTYTFMFLYTKTGNDKYLQWARKMSNVYWRLHDPKTNLIPNYVSGSENSVDQLDLAYYFLRAVELYPDPVIRERALKMVDAWQKYGYNPETGKFAQELVPATGEPKGIGSAVFKYGNYDLFYRLLAFWHAYKVTKDQTYLDVVLKSLKNVAHYPVPDNISPEVTGQYIMLFIDAYRASHIKDYLIYARSFASWSLKHLVRKGLILEAANGHVYFNWTHPGFLMQAWLKLYELEQQLPLHWTGPESLLPQDGLCRIVAKPKSGKEKIKLKYHFHGGKEGWAKAVRSKDKYEFVVPVSNQSSQGPLTLRFVSAGNGQEIDQGTIVVAKNPNGPVIGPWDLVKWIDRESYLTGKVKVIDPSGIVAVKCRYMLPEKKEIVTVQCSKVADVQNGAWYSFTIPPVRKMKSDSIILWIEATGNPAWPISDSSPEKVVMFSNVSQISLSCPAGETKTIQMKKVDGEIVVKPGRNIRNVSVRLENIPINPVAADNSLPALLLPGFLVIKPGKELAGDGGSCFFEWNIDSKKAMSILTSTLAVYRWNGKLWEKTAGIDIDPLLHVVKLPCKEGGVFVVGGEQRLLWRRTFNGALLSSPAVARISKKGDLEIILDTRNADGYLYALDKDGNTLWTYDAAAQQSFPTVADLDGNGLDEIAVGGPNLVLLEHDGKTAWQAKIKNVNSPVIGDIDGDGQQEIVGATEDGFIAAFSAKGRELWRLNVGDALKIPALANLNGDSKLELVVGGNKALYAVSNKGKLLWQQPLAGQALYSPAVGDLNGDGTEEVIVFSRTDDRGTMCAFDGKGKVLWKTNVSRESDWCPVIADMDGAGKPQIIAQMVDVRKLGIYNAHGKLVRTINTTGRTLQTPVPVFLDDDNRLDLLSDFDLSYKLWAIANDGHPLWSYTPHSYTLGGAKIKGGGTLLVADINGDGFLEIVGGDDETWLNAIRTDTACKPWQIVSGQFHGDARHTGNYFIK